MRIRRPLAIALVSSVALAGLVTVTATGASGAAPAAKLQPRAVSNTTTWAAVKTVSLPGTASNGPAVGIAVNSADDTVYVVNSDTDRLAVINGNTGTLDDSFTVANVRAVAVDQNDDTIYTVTVPPTGTLNKVQSRSASSPGVAVTDDTVDSAVVLAVDSLDDTVYVGRSSTPGYITYFSGRTPLNDDTQNVGGRGVYGLAVDQLDDSVWMAYGADDSTRAWNGRTLALGSFIGTGDQPLSVAVNGPDDTVYVADSLTPNNITVINGRTNSLVRTLDGPFAVGTESGLAVDDSNGLLFTASGGVSSTLGVIKQANLDDSVYVGATFATGIPSPARASSYYKAVAVDDSGLNRGLVWAYSPSNGNVVQALTQVSASLTGTTTGAAGARVFVTVTSPTVVAPFVMDTDTVLGVRFNSSSLVTSITREDDTTWSVALPSGLPAGNVPVEVQFNGYQYALAGTYTVQSSGPPTPTPVYPPGAPTDVKATAGTGEATVSWTAPTYIGSYPITDYQVTSSTGSHTCLTKSTSCTLTGLTGGTSYTFEVRALNGAGWGAYSTPSNAVTPVAKTILITGSREASDTRYVKVQGTTTDLVGKQVTPYVRFPGQTGYTAGIGVQTVAADGTFTWQRKTGKKISVYFVHGGVSSNTIAIAAR